MPELTALEPFGYLHYLRYIRHLRDRYRRSEILYAELCRPFRGVPIDPVAACTPAGQEVGKRPRFPNHPATKPGKFLKFGDGTAGRHCRCACPK